LGLPPCVRARIWAGNQPSLTKTYQEVRGAGSWFDCNSSKTCGDTMHPQRQQNKDEIHVECILALCDDEAKQRMRISSFVCFQNYNFPYKITLTATNERMSSYSLQQSLPSILEGSTRKRGDVEAIEHRSRTMQQAQKTVVKKWGIIVIIVIVDNEEGRNLINFCRSKHNNIGLFSRC